MSEQATPNGSPKALQSLKEKLLAQFPQGSSRPFLSFMGRDGIMHTFDLSKLSPQDRVAFRVDIMARYFAEAIGPAQTLTPPATAEKLLSFLLAPDRLHEVIGDFDEGYLLMLQRHGLGHARRWYYGQVLKVALRAVVEVMKTIWDGFRPI